LTTPETGGKIQAFITPFAMTTPCKHPIVKVVARQEDVEFVECQNCGEIFDSIEYEDMAVEDKEHLNDDLKGEESGALDTVKTTRT